jgi:signal transduction histidine kinase
VTDRELLLRRAVLLADASRLLASLELDAALDGVGHLLASDLAEAVSIDVLQGDKGPRRLVSVQAEGGRPLPRAISAAVLANSGQLAARGAQSYISVPISTRRGVIGALTLCAPRARRYTHSDLELADELARRIALAMENAELHREAKAALRARDEFLSVAAHEMRGPVTSLHLAVQSLQREMVTPAARTKALAIIERDDRRISRFIDELLDVARVRSGTMAFNFEQIDAGGVLREVASQLAPELARSGSELALKTQGDLAGSWDRLRLGQVFTNLLSNAIKFGLGKPIEACLEATPEGISLRVEDHGIGIAPEAQPSIFQPFERAVPARRYGGLGLGLYIVRTIVDALGGTIQVESAPRTKTTFVVDVPRRK